MKLRLWEGPLFGLVSMGLAIPAGAIDVDDQIRYCAAFETPTYEKVREMGFKLEAGAKLTINELSLDAAKGKVIIDGDLSQKVLRVGTSPASLASVARLRVLKDGRVRRVLVDEDGWVGGEPGALLIIR